MTNDELLDLVDADDNIIGEVWKSKANSDPSLTHREIAILLRDDDENLLLQQRSHRKQVSPLRWTVSCAGHVGKGEDIAECAKRELKEELGFAVPLTFVGKVLIKHPNETHIAYFYTGNYLGEQITIDKEEVEEAKLTTTKEALSLLTDESLFFLQSLLNQPEPATGDLKFMSA